MAKRHGEKYWQQHLEAWHQSDLTQIAYCTSRGLSLKSFYRWRRKEKVALAVAKSSLTLVPASVGKLDANNVARVRSPDGWEIELPGSSIPLLIDFLRELS